MLSLKQLPKQQRPRERMLHDKSSISDTELLAIIIGKGTKEKNAMVLSQEILAMHSLQQLSQMNVHALQQIKGIGLAKACQIAASFMLCKRVSHEQNMSRIISHPKDVFTLLKHELSPLQQEHIVGLYMDTRKRVLHKETLFIGTLDSSVIHPREIYKPALALHASAIILVHNHPSGDPTPSSEDIRITKQLINAGELLGIPFLDHIIIGKEKYVSLCS